MVKPEQHDFQEATGQRDLAGQVIHAKCPQCQTPLNIVTTRVPEQPTHEITLNYFGRVVITVKGISVPEVWELYCKVNESLPKGTTAAKSSEGKDSGEVKMAIDQFVR